MQINSTKNEKITDRILQVLENKNITKYKFCKDLGFSNGFLDKSREIATDKYANILVYFPDVAPEWLLTGKGDIYKTKNIENATKNNGGKNGGKNDEKRKMQKMPPNKEDYNGIVRKLKYADSVVLSNTGAPYYEEPVSAGLLDYAEQPTKPIGYIDLPGIKCVAYFPVTGVSFKPIINPGDVIGVDYIDSAEILDPDSIYYIITTHSRMIKHLMNDPEDESQLICLSTNYKEFRIDKEDIKKIYKVVFFGRLL